MEAPSPTAKRELMIALSGGGHRAALFDLGVLLAIVDRGLNTVVQKIASVSGGSIVNAFIALHCDLQKTSSEDFYGIAGRLVSKIIHKGVLTRPIIIAILAALLAPPFVFAELAHRQVIPWLAAAPLAVLWLCLGLLRGLIIEFLLEIRYFPPQLDVNKSFPFLRLVRQRIGSVHSGSVEHSVCCTELLEGRPVYFQLKEGCLLDVISPNEISKQPVSQLSIASVVRASAAFPGIPPRRVRLPWVKPHSILEAAEPAVWKTILLADGGVWNNLASEMIRNDLLIYLHQLEPEDPLLLADASEPPPTQKIWPYYVPGWELIRSLLRIVNIQHLNTVEPRLLPMKMRQMKRTDKWRKRDGTELPVDIPVRLKEDTGQLWEIFKLLFNPDRMLSDMRPWHGVDKLKDFYSLVELAKGDVYIGTHLGRVRPENAIALLARGYANTFLWTYELKPYDVNDAELLATVPGRLRAMVTK